MCEFFLIGTLYFIFFQYKNNFILKAVVVGAFKDALMCYIHSVPFT